MSAAASISFTLAAVIIGAVLAIGGGAWGWWQWQERKKQERLELMAVLYGKGGKDEPAPQRRRRRAPQLPSLYVLQQGQKEEPWEVVG